MASKYEISAVFKMIDNFTGPLSKVAGSGSKFAKKFSSDMAKMELQIKAAGQALKKMAGLAAVAGATMAVKTVIDGAKAYVEFEDAVTKAGSKFKDLDVTSSDFTQTLEEMQTAAREVGAKTKFTAQDAAGALDKFAMAGVSSKDAMAMLMGTTNLAVTAGTDLTTAVDIATDAMGIFGKSLNARGVTDVADQLNLISDVMAKTSTTANTDLQGLFEAMTYAGPSLTSAGQSIEMISAALGTLANAGIKGSAGGTALNAVFTQLGNPKKQKQLEAMGISVKDAQGNFKDFATILKDIEKVTSNMGTAEKSGFLNSIFRTQGAKAMNTLLQTGGDSLREYVEVLENAKGTSEAIANVQSNSFAGMIEQLKSAWADKLLSFGKAFETGGARDALQRLIGWVQNLDVTPIVDFISDLMRKIPEIVEKVGDFLKKLWDIRDFILILVEVWGGYKIAVFAALSVEKVVMFINMMKGVEGAITGAGVAQEGLNVVMGLCPIMALVTAVGLMTVGLVKLFKAGESASTAMEDAFGINSYQRRAYAMEKLKLNIRLWCYDVGIWFNELGIKIWNVVGKIPFLSGLANDAIAKLQSNIDNMNEKKALATDQFYEKLAIKGLEKDRVDLITDTYKNMSFGERVKSTFDANYWADKGLNAMPKTEQKTEVNLSVNVHTDAQGQSTAAVTMPRRAPNVTLQTHKTGSF